MSNFSDKYFVLVLRSFCLKQFHLFQNYTERASSLITVPDKEPDSGISDNGAEKLLQLQRSCSSFLLLYLSTGLAKNICLWTS